MGEMKANEREKSIVSCRNSGDKNRTLEQARSQVKERREGSFNESPDHTRKRHGSRRSLVSSSERARSQGKKRRRSGSKEKIGKSRSRQSSPVRSLSEMRGSKEAKESYEDRKRKTEKISINFG